MSQFAELAKSTKERTTYKHGGLGSAVANGPAQTSPAPLRMVALNGDARSGPYYELRDGVGLGPDALKKAIIEVVSN